MVRHPFPFLILCFLFRASILNAEPKVPSFEMLNSQTVPGLGAGQGLMVHQGKVYLYGDAETGVIREYDLKVTDGKPELIYTNLEIKLTHKGEDICPHPTGLSVHPDYGCFLGNTVAQKGTIFHVDWQQMKKDGNLDNALKNTTIENKAVNGCRPEFIRVGEQWFVGTSDYGDKDNALRLYDPVKLAKAKFTSDPGVMKHNFPCGPWVQTLHYSESDGIVFLVQNQIVGLRYRLTAVELFNMNAGAIGYKKRKVMDFAPTDELEGFEIFEHHTLKKVPANRATSPKPAHKKSRWGIFFSSSKNQNVRLARVK